MTSTVRFIQVFWSKRSALTLCALRSHLAKVPDTMEIHQETHNQIWGPHSIPTSLVVSGSNLETSLRSYVTGRFRIKTVLNDQCGSVRKVLSVRHRRPRFARPPIGVRRDRLSIRTLLDGRTHTIKSEDLTPLLRIWSFRIKGVPQRPAVKDISRKSPCETYIHPHMYTYIHT